MKKYLAMCSGKALLCAMLAGGVVLGSGCESQADKDLVYLRAQKEKEVAENEKNRLASEAETARLVKRLEETRYVMPPKREQK